MTGLVKAKQYDWKDSNMALFGSDTEKQVKKESAESEPAWQGSGQQPGLEIWRIVKFKVERVPKDEYGHFYSGDSYIILNTYQDKERDALLYDVHFWIGRYSSQDEYGTAAYKTVELDTYHDDKPVQHREVQGHESTLFISYFKAIVIMEGGADSGFKHVKPEEYRSRLMRFKGNAKHVVVREVSLKESSLTDDDVYILDNGLTLYQWNGQTSNKWESFAAAQWLQGIKSERGRAKVETVDQGESEEDEFFEILRKGESEREGEDELEDIPDGNEDEGIKLYRLSDSSGSLQFQFVRDGISTHDLMSEDVFIIDSGKKIFSWVGKKASREEKKNALSYACNYANSTQHPLSPITALQQGKKNVEFEQLMAMAA